MMPMNPESVIQSELCQKGKKKILYANSYIWNLEKWDWITYSQGRNRDADAENALVDTVGGGQGETVRQQ